jgi:outer membrane lipoprotein-sorting protein
MNELHSILAAGLFCASLLTGAGAENVDKVLARMDQNAAIFKGMDAKVRQLSHTAVINEDNVSTGITRMNRSKKDIHVLVVFSSPDPKSVGLSGTKAEIYYPKLQTVEEYDLGKNRELMEQFLLLGYGASGKDLKNQYTVQWVGEESVAGQKTTRLELISKSKQVQQQFPKIELWVSDATGYPVQQKLHQTGGDYMMVTYTDVTINPALPDSAFKLEVPKGVKRVFPGK